MIIIIIIITAPEHSYGPQNWENPNLGPLDSATPEKKSKPKRTKWMREEYKEVVTDFLSSIK